MDGLPKERDGDGKYIYFQEFCCMGKQRNGVIDSWRWREGMKSRFFFRAEEITLYLYANENDPVWGGGLAKQYLH